jgi:stage IV sporulation protein FB
MDLRICATDTPKSCKIIGRCRQGLLAGKPEARRDYSLSNQLKFSYYADMSWSFSIGRLFGSELRIHATFFLLLAWIGASAWLAEGTAAAITNIVFVLSLFACVVLHEFGHALAARRYGIRTPDITLLPIGGMARLEKMPEKPAEEIVVAIAGPAVNVLIWAVLTVALGATAGVTTLMQLDEPAQGFWARLAAVNLFLVVFNMIPAFPMDGGRVLRAVLSFFMDRPKATRIAARAGQGIAFLFGFLGLTSGNPLLLLIAIFIFMAAAAESSDVLTRERAHDVPARVAMITSFERLAPDDTLEAAAQSLLRTTQAEFPVVDAQGTLVGVLTRAQIVDASAQKRATSPVSDAMTAEIPRVLLDTSLETVLDSLSKPGVPAVAVQDRRGNFLGYITRENFGEWMLLNRST